MQGKMLAVGVINKTKSCREYEEPKEHIVSDGEILIKNLLQKQLYTNINLKEELKRENHFSKSTEFVNITSKVSGANSLETFKKYEENIHNLEMLKSYDLSNSDIELYSDYKEDCGLNFEKYKNVCKTVLQEKICYILQVINKTQSKDTSGNAEKCTISRHLKEIALSVKPESNETKLYNFTLCNSSSTTDNDSSAVNHIVQLEKQLFKSPETKLCIPSFKKRRKRARKYLDEDSNLLFSDSNSHETGITQSNPETKWDSKKAHILKGHEVAESKKVYTCLVPTKYTVKDNKIVKVAEVRKEVEKDATGSGKPFIGWSNLKGEEQNTPVIFQKFHVWDENAVRALPKFQNYKKGTPSQILYLKNLARSVKKEDLIRLFQSFDSEKQKITYRLLSGKMQGQAFITFTSVEQATKALETLNGYELKGKLLIIEYGKKTM